MPAPTKITKRFPIPNELKLLKEKIKRPCDSGYWEIHGRFFGKEACMEFIKQDLIEREKQLFQYYQIPYAEIESNSIHYLIRQLAAAAGFHGFEFAKDHSKYRIGDWAGSFGEVFCLRVMLHMLKNKQKIKQKSIDAIKNEYTNYSAYDEAVLNKKFCEVFQNNSTINEFYSKITKNISVETRNQLISDIELYLTTCHDI